MNDLFGYAFARLERGKDKRTEFAQTWEKYISTHPWDTVINEVAERTFELRVAVLTPTPSELSLIFSEWLAALRAALDNGLYAWATAATGLNPPPDAEKLQFPICITRAEFRKQAKRLATLPGDIVEKLEKAQPYQSPYGPKSNLLFWLHELARTDRHRTPHIGLGRIATHKVRVGVPEGTVVDFDTTVQPFDFIDNDVVIARFTTSRPLRPTQLTIDPGIGIDPEIRDWAGFELKGVRKLLWDRMIMTEIFMLNHIENMARFSNYFPPGGFQTFDP